MSWNRYAYVLSNPLINTDPTGRDVLLGNKPVDDFPLANHTFIVVAPTGENKELYKNRMDSKGLIYLAGGPGGPVKGKKGTRLVKWEGADSLSKAHQVVTIKPGDQTHEQFEKNVIEAFDSYVDGAEHYDNVAAPGSGNCNSLTSGVLDAAGAGDVKPKSGFLGLFGQLVGWHPGYNKPVDLPDATAND